MHMRKLRREEHIRRLGLPPSTTEEELEMHMRKLRREQHLKYLRLDPAMSESEYQEVLGRLRRGKDGTNLARRDIPALSLSLQQLSDLIGSGLKLSGPPSTTMPSLHGMP